jgi:hypothetical protein
MCRLNTEAPVVLGGETEAQNGSGSNQFTASARQYSPKGASRQAQANVIRNSKCSFFL